MSVSMLYPFSQIIYSRFLRISDLTFARIQRIALMDDKEQCWRRTETEIQKRDRGKLEWKIGSTQAQELPYSSVRGVTTPFRFTRRPDANVCIGRATFFYLTRNSCAVRNKIAWNARRLYKNQCEDIYLSSKIKTFRKEINATIYYTDLK